MTTVTNIVNDDLASHASYHLTYQKKSKSSPDKVGKENSEHKENIDDWTNKYVGLAPRKYEEGSH